MFANIVMFIALLIIFQFAILPSFALCCASHAIRNLALYLYSSKDGYCYLVAFGYRYPTVALLGAFPSVRSVEVLYLVLNFSFLHWSYETTYVGDKCHLTPRTTWACSLSPFINPVGASTYGATSWQTNFDPRFEAWKEGVSVAAHRSAAGLSRLPGTNQLHGEASRLTSNLALEFNRLPPMPSIPRPHAHRLIEGDATSSPSHRGLKKMDAISSMEAAKVLLSGLDSLGTAQERLAMVREAFPEGIPTSVHPSDPSYSRLVKLLGPLKYSPRIEAHPAAATIRRAALDHATAALQGTIVGLVSPSKAEIHAFSRAVIWEYTDSQDRARRMKQCSICKNPTCFVRDEASKAGRVLVSNDWKAAAAHFKRFDTGSLLLMNIEPNLDARSLTSLMVRAGVYNAYSLSSIDWRIILGRKCFDSLTGMTTELAFGKVVSSFHDGGDYVQDIAKVKQMFAPTYASGHALRRTSLFADHASQYQELTLVEGGWATRSVPAHDKYYFIKVMMPDGVRPTLMVEKHGFDRVLATYRSQAIKDRSVARIVLRQSVVTYSISGTQVTPRISLTATEAEALSVWIEIYSEVQDRCGDSQAERLRPKGYVDNAKKSIYAGVQQALSASAPGVMALQTTSSIDALLRVYREDIGEMTLEQMSERAMEEHFGAKLDPLSLQNVVISAWQSVYEWVTNPKLWLKKIDQIFTTTWNVSFGYLDVVVVAGVLGMNFTMDVVDVVLDCVVTAARITGKEQAMQNIERFIRHCRWPLQKVERFWITVQEAQALDFQAATIDIVETFFNVFSVDYAEQIQQDAEERLQGLQIPQGIREDIEANARLPYDDFLSEIKLFLAKFNSRAKRSSMAAMLLSAFHHDCRHASAEQKSRMLHMLKEQVVLDAPEIRRELGWALTGNAPETALIPLRPIDNQDIRERFEAGSMTLASPHGEVVLHRLKLVDGKADFGPIHEQMDLQHTDVVNPANLRGPNYISPDERGADIQQKLINYAADQGVGAMFARPTNMMAWHTQALANANIDYVARVLRESVALFEGDSMSNWIAHMTGLAMGGKSKGFRQWITSQDLVVVPTDQLKRDWQEELGKLDPVHRAAVVTQHVALENKLAARYVIIDECYAFDPEHLQAIANRHHRSRGIITIGDKRQIGNVFSPTGLHLELNEVPCVMITPTTFVPWDAAALYLTHTTTDTHVPHLYCGASHAEGMRYTLSSEDVLLPGEGDLSIQGTQLAKEHMRMRGVETNTTHECQGRRSETTVTHTVGRALTADMRWLADPERAAHMGVTITRARKATTFVVDSVNDLAVFRWFDDTIINGRLPHGVIYGGTSWDLVEPLAESESVWVHLREENIAESNYKDTPLTDPVTIGTVFTKEGEAIAANEITTNIELTDGCRFTDDFRETAKGFDNYTLQPRDVPGADIVQALTRKAKTEATPNDFIDAETIVEYIFEEVIDKKIFFAHVANSRRAAITRQTRQQVIDGCYARTETAASTMSFAFLKPEYAKKPSELDNGPSELKAQGVVAASDLQQAMFADVCDALTHAWARSMRPGKLSPVGMHEEEVEQFLGTFERSYELDIEKQDSSHRAVHIIVASIMIELASDKLGLGTMAREIRQERTVRMMATPFKFVLEKSLASGDPWTLIINKIMAVSSLISVARLANVRMCQSGDDVTLDREPEWRQDSLTDQLAANVGLRWKVEEREQRQNGVTFISRAVLPNNTVVYKALRTILKYAWRPRNQIQHAGITADAKRIEKLSAKHGLQAYAEARALVWGGDPVVIFDLWTRALAIARTEFKNLPDSLKTEEPRGYTIRSRDGGCFGYALANCVQHNVQAVNAIATYRGPVSQSTALAACRDNKVPIIFINEQFAHRSRKRLIDQMDRRKISRSFVVCYEDHAVAVVPNTIILHGAFGKREITWKFTDSKDVLISDFE